MYILKMGDQQVSLLVFLFGPSKLRHTIAGGLAHLARASASLLAVQLRSCAGAGARDRLLLQAPEAEAEVVGSA